MFRTILRFRSILTLIAALSLTHLAHAETAWTPLSGRPLDEVFVKPGKWHAATEVTLASKNPKQLASTPSKPESPILVNGEVGRVADLLTTEKYQDVELKCEFFIAKGSNSGIKFNGQYKIQIIDNPPGKKLTGDSTGGIYPRAEFKPKYHHIDDGIAPKENAAKSPGEWQTLHVIFQSPRFDDAGKKTTNARFVKVVVNGKTVHENVEVAAPTGHAWHNKEMAKGPILFQGDHGPVAFREVQVRAWAVSK